VPADAPVQTDGDSQQGSSSDDENVPPLLDVETLRVASGCFQSDSGVLHAYFSGAGLSSAAGPRCGTAAS